MIVSLWHLFQFPKTFNFHCQFKSCPLPSPGKTGEQPKRKLRRARETQNNVSYSWATMMMWPVKRWPPAFFSFSKFCCPPPTVRALMARYQLSIPARPFKAHTPPTTWLSATGNRQIRAELEPVGRRLCQKKIIYPKFGILGRPGFDTWRLLDITQESVDRVWHSVTRSGGYIQDKSETWNVQT